MRIVPRALEDDEAIEAASISHYDSFVTMLLPTFYILGRTKRELDSQPKRNSFTIGVEENSGFRIIQLRGLVHVRANSQWNLNFIKYSRPVLLFSKKPARKFSKLGQHDRTQR